MFGLASGGETPTDLEIFTNAFQPSFPILPDAAAIYNQYRQPSVTSPYPLDYILDQQGNVAYFNTEYDPEAMIAVIDQLLAQEPNGETPTVIRSLEVTARPNPFNPQTLITFTIPQTGTVNLDIHDIRGRLVRRLIVETRYDAGKNSIAWDGTNNNGRVLPSGLYLMHVRSAGSSVTGKLTLVR